MSFSTSMCPIVCGHNLDLTVSEESVFRSCSCILAAQGAIYWLFSHMQIILFAPKGHTIKPARQNIWNKVCDDWICVALANNNTHPFNNNPIFLRAAPTWPGASDTKISSLWGIVVLSHFIRQESPGCRPLPWTQKKHPDGAYRSTARMFLRITACVWACVCAVFHSTVSYCFYRLTLL